MGGVVLGEHADPASSAPSAKQDAEILNFALLLEYVQAGFHAEALQRAKLTGELQTFARTAAAHEQDHIELLKQALGSAARKPPTLDFGDDTADEERVLAGRVQARGPRRRGLQRRRRPNLTKGALRAAARIVSVESRHAAWIRDLRGMNPAPDAAEPAVDAQRVIDTFKGSGYVK